MMSHFATLSSQIYRALMATSQMRFKLSTDSGKIHFAVAESQMGSSVLRRRFFNSFPETSGQNLDRKSDMRRSHFAGNESLLGSSVLRRKIQEESHRRKRVTNRKFSATNTPSFILANTGLT